MTGFRECIIDGCANLVAPMNEVDVGVGIVCSNEVPICELCCTSDDLGIIEQIKELENMKDDFPF